MATVSAGQENGDIRFRELTPDGIEPNWLYAMDIGHATIYLTQNDLDSIVRFIQEYQRKVATTNV